MHFVALVARGLAADPNRVPWGNMYEFTISGTFVVALIFVLATLRIDIEWLGPLVTTFVVAALMAAFLGLDDAVLPLPDALNSPWLVIHVVSAVISTGAFTLGALLSGLYLVKSRSSATTGYLARVPEPKVLDRLSYRMHAFGFPVWTFARPHHRSDLGAPGVGGLLELGPQGGVGLHHVGGLRRLPARPRDRGLARPQRGDPGAGRCRDAVVQLHRHQLLQLQQPALLRRGSRAGDVSRPPGLRGRSRSRRKSGSSSGPITRGRDVPPPSRRRSVSLTRNHTTTAIRATTSRTFSIPPM